MTNVLVTSQCAAANCGHARGQHSSYTGCQQSHRPDSICLECDRLGTTELVDAVTRKARASELLEVRVLIDGLRDTAEPELRPGIDAVLYLLEKRAHRTKD